MKRKDLPKCPKCGDTDVCNFNKKTSNTWSSWCKNCDNSAHKQRKLKQNNIKGKSNKNTHDNKERNRLLGIAYRRRNPIVTILRDIKRNAIKRGLEFDLKAEDFTMISHCPVLGIPIIVACENRDFRPSIDRVDNKKGYLKSNCILISYKANRLKSDSDLNTLWLLHSKYKEIITGKSELLEI